jgi:hypothetical protein
VADVLLDVPEELHALTISITAIDKVSIAVDLGLRIATLDRRIIWLPLWLELPIE